jgi:tRNA threonylcarbamoyl adenosine modification protein (Sua5/YciO/YrdC/YwlC family)
MAWHFKLRPRKKRRVAFFRRSLSVNSLPTRSLAMPSQFIEIHPKDPQPRLIKRTVEILREGGIVVYPTDSCYALGCHIGDKAAMERIARIRQTDKHHHFTLVCRDLSEIAKYARVNNQQYRTLRAFTPGPYTFILQATKETPKRLQNPKRRTIGIRVPEHRVSQLILEELNEPLMSSTLMLPGDEMPLTDAREIQERLYHEVDAVIDGGNCGLEPTSVIDLEGPAPLIARRGKGDVSAFE